MSMAELYHDAWENPLAHNSLKPGDLILRVEIPTSRRRSAYLQASDKHTFDWALVSCAAAGQKTAGAWAQLAVFLGAVAPIPYAVESPLLERGELTSDSIASIAETLAAKATPLAQNGYKLPIAQALVRRCLDQITT